MEISIITKAEYESSVGFNETVDAFDNTIQRVFTTGEELSDDSKVYERTGNDLLPPTYDVGDEGTYTLNQVVFKDAVLKYVSALGSSTVIKQPEEYSPPANLGYGSWGNRYANIGNIDPISLKWSATVNGVTHSLRFDGANWKYKLTKTVTTKYWGAEKFDLTAGNKNGFTQTTHRHPYPLLIGVDYDNIHVYNSTAQEPYVVAYQTIITVGSDRYRCGSLRIGYNEVGYLGVQKELSKSTVVETEVTVTMLNECDLSVSEAKAYCHNSSNCANEWFPKTIIRRGNALYIRTDTDDAVQTKLTTNVEFTTLERLDEAGGWGWTYIRPTAEYAPLDDKMYTNFKGVAPIEYTVKGVQPFDTIAFGSLIAEEIEVTFIPDDGSAAIDMIPMYPQNNIDEDSRLPSQPTTMVVYAPRDITGTVHTKFISTQEVQIGWISLGQRASAGFSDLVFTNRFKDYSPYEKDQYGNILYVKGVRTNVYSGTVNIELKYYDMINRLLASIGGETVILNGSDTTDNEPVDNVDFFASTMVIGRIRNFNLKTKLDRGFIGQAGTYTFEIEEDV